MEIDKKPRKPTGRSLKSLNKIPKQKEEILLMLKGKRYDTNKTSAENQSALNNAKILFLRDFGFEDIFIATEIPPDIFKYHAYEKPNCWVKERNTLVDLLLENAVKDKFEDVLEVKGLTVSVLKRWVLRLATRETEMDFKEAKLASEILSNFDKIARLDKGIPTEIKRDMSLSPQELRSEIKKNY
jgi:hypothetical protein